MGGTFGYLCCWTWHVTCSTLRDISTLLSAAVPDKSVNHGPGQPTATTSTTNSSGSTQMQAWMQGAIAKFSSSNDGVSNSTASPVSGSATFMPISINTGTFPGTPAVRLIGDCHFLHRLCQLLLFCYFQRLQASRNHQRNADASSQKLQTGATSKSEEVNSAKPNPALNRMEEAQGFRTSQLGAGVKGIDDNSARTTKMGSGNAGQGYTFEEVGTCIPCLHFYTIIPGLKLIIMGENNENPRLVDREKKYALLISSIF